MNETEDAYQSLREMMLDAVENGLTQPSPEHPDVSGLIVDIPAEGGFVTIVSLTDGTTSVYTSTGGGTVGAGAHEAVAEANERLLSVVQTHLEVFTLASDGSLPDSGHVRFHVLTPSERRYVDVSLDAFWGRADHQLTPMVASVQDLITAISEVSG